MNPYEILGVSKDASQKEVSDAYKRRAKQTHPDKEGGDHEEFVKVSLAFEILSNPEKREYYDRTGQTDQQSIKAEDILGNILGNLVVQWDIEDVKHTDIIVKITFAVSREKRKYTDMLDMITKEMEKLDEMEKRIVSDSPFFKIFIEKARNKAKIMTDECDLFVKLINEIIELLEKGSYIFEEKEPEEKIDIKPFDRFINPAPKEFKGFFNGFL